MPKLDSDDDERPGRPAGRRFPWRLWLYAIAMTGAAGFAGYRYWQLRGQLATARDEAVACRASLDKQKPAGKPAPPPAAPTAQPSSATASAAAPAAAAAAPGSPPGAAPPPASPPPASPAAGALGPPAPAPTSDGLAATVDELRRLLGKMIEAGQLRMTARRGSAVLTLPADGLFVGDTAELSRPGELAALEVGIMLKRFPDRRLLVIAHADERPAKAGAVKDAWELTVARAGALARALGRAGVEPRNLVAAGAGDGDPLPGDPSASRRVEIILWPAPRELAAPPASLGADTAGPPAEAPLAPGPAPRAPGAAAAVPSTPPPLAPTTRPAAPAPAPSPPRAPADAATR